MKSTRSRLVVLRGASLPDARILDALRSEFDLIEVDDVAAARAMLQQQDAGPVSLVGELQERPHRQQQSAEQQRQAQPVLRQQRKQRARFRFPSR
jgi:hypothetical protein